MNIYTMMKKEKIKVSCKERIDFTVKDFLLLLV